MQAPRGEMVLIEGTAGVSAPRPTEGESDSAPRLAVSLVGRLSIRFQGRVVELRTRKAAAVLGYLALSETKQESRERRRRDASAERNRSRRWRR